METVGPTALVVAILYFLGRWALATVDFAAAHPGRGRPEVTWMITWLMALVVSGMGAASVHIRILEEAMPSRKIVIFNAVIFGGFFLGFLVSGLLDHRARLATSR
jgi:hypothetical protein